MRHKGSHYPNTETHRVHSHMGVSFQGIQSNGERDRPDFRVLAYTETFHMALLGDKPY